MLIPLPALNDNYIWVYARNNLPAIVIDPADFRQVENCIRQHHIDLEAVLLTHYHDDHTAGVAALKAKYPRIPVYGPGETEDKGATDIVESGEFQTGHYHIRVIETGGHTAQHVSFMVDNHLFCGDTLFSAGCGRVFTGDYAQMFDSIGRLKQLPDDTIICPGHEYTLSNLAFAEAVSESEECKSAVRNYRISVQQLRAEGKPSVPTALALEKQINPFLQAETLEKFTALRKAKDNF